MSAALALDRTAFAATCTMLASKPRPVGMEIRDPAPRALRVLIADDHIAVRKGVRDLLERDPRFEVVAEVSTGLEALAQARQAAPEIAIIDYCLPGLNGRELTLTLKQRLPRIAVVIYTALDSEKVIWEVLQAGARGFVLKSDPSGQLLAAIDALSTGHPYFSGEIFETLFQYCRESNQAEGCKLTVRERQVIQLIAEGSLNKQIAGLLGISIKTVETHRATVMCKLQLRTTADLVRYALRNEIVQA